MKKFFWVICENFYKIIFFSRRKIFTTKFLKGKFFKGKFFKMKNFSNENFKMKNL